MCRTSRPAGSGLRRPARARRRAGLVRACGRGGLPDRCHPIDAAVEALAEYPSLPPGWKTGTAALRERRRRAARGSQCPRSGTGSGRAGQCACRGLVIDLSWTRRIPAPVTCLDHQAAKSACAAASEVPGRLAQIRREASGAFHLQRPRYWPTLDRGAGNSHLVADENPRQLDRCARGLRVRCSVRFTDVTSCDFMAVPAEMHDTNAGSGTAWYRLLPGWNATSEQTWSNHGSGRFRDLCAAERLNSLSTAPGSPEKRIRWVIPAGAHVGVNLLPDTRRCDGS